MGNMKQCISQNKLFQHMTMLRYWVDWLILILIQSHYTWHEHSFNIAKLYPLFLLSYLNSHSFSALYLQQLACRYNANPWFKVGLSSSKQIFVICLIENPLKLMKNAFHFMLKALCHKFLVMCKNNSIRKTKLTSKFMTSQPGLQTIAIQILSNTSQTKSNQTMNVDQLI